MTGQRLLTLSSLGRRNRGGKPRGRSCELRFHGESYGWEAQFFERGELLFSRGGFVTGALAVQWAEEERAEMEGASTVKVGAAVGRPAASVCPRCQNLLWICEQHPDRPWPHDDCHGPGDPCPRCNDGDPPACRRISSA